ncbi:MAG: serine hydrolase [Pseudomonadales bacterium]|nr:beta-lactamase family protein [Pseudomonadales bacterium]NIX06788.1 serine hydrolase [Pseudomonadales bacterium]
MTVDVHGFCDERFRPLADAFVANFEEELEAGASLAMTHQGRMVVDLWAGTRDAAGKHPWERDTIVQLFSTTKIIVILCILKLIDDGLLELDAPVARYWPEFGQAGKSAITVRQALLHQASVPGLKQKQPFEAQFDWERVIALIAAEEPWFEPGTSCYHPITYGYILGELTRRVTGSMLSDYFESEFAIPLKTDFQFVLKNEADLARIALPVIISGTLDELHEPGSVSEKVFASFESSEKFLSMEHLQAEIPSGNGLGNARSLALLGTLLAQDGVINGVRYLSTNIVAQATIEQANVEDLIIGPARFGLGFGLDSETFPAPSPTAFHWGGFGGSWLVMDRASTTSCAYAMNGLHVPALDGEEFLDPRQKRFWDVLSRVMKDLDGSSKASTASAQ